MFHFKASRCAECKKDLRGEVAHHVTSDGKRLCLKCFRKRQKPGPSYAMAE